VKNERRSHRERIAKLPAAAAERRLDEEVESAEDQPDDQEEGRQGKTASAWETADGQKNTGGDDAEARLRSRQIKRPDGFKAGKIPPERAELVLHPVGKLLAMAPKVDAAQADKTVAQARQQTKRGTCSPIKHDTSRRARPKTD